MTLKRVWTKKHFKSYLCHLLAMNMGKLFDTFIKMSKKYICQKITVMIILNVMGITTAPQ